jgi:hypothetical protein
MADDMRDSERELIDDIIIFVNDILKRLEDDPSKLIKSLHKVICEVPLLWRRILQGAPVIMTTMNELNSSGKLTEVDSGFVREIRVAFSCCDETCNEDAADEDDDKEEVEEEKMEKEVEVEEVEEEDVSEIDPRFEHAARIHGILNLEAVYDDDDADDDGDADDDDDDDDGEGEEDVDTYCGFPEAA